jgi:hypothetical protein
VNPADLANSGTTVLDDFQTHTGNQNHMLSTSSSTQCQRLEMRHFKNSATFKDLDVNDRN